MAEFQRIEPTIDQSRALAKELLEAIDQHGTIAIVEHLIDEGEGVIELLTLYSRESIVKIDVFGNVEKTFSAGVATNDQA